MMAGKTQDKASYDEVIECRTGKYESYA